MKPILKWLAMLMLVVGIHSFSYARETAANDGKLKKGEQAPQPSGIALLSAIC